MFLWILGICIMSLEGLHKVNHYNIIKNIILSIIFILNYIYSWRITEKPIVF